MQRETRLDAEIGSELFMNVLLCCRPFLPPCLVVALLSLLAMINSSFMMVETHPRLRKQPKQAPEIAPMGTDTPPADEKTPVSMFAKAHPLPEGDAALLISAQRAPDVLLRCAPKLRLHCMVEVTSRQTQHSSWNRELYQTLVMACTGGQTSSTEEPPSPMLRRLSSGLETGREEARQLLQKASSRFSGLLSGYRSLSVHSDDLDRHEYGATLRTLCPTHT